MEIIPVAIEREGDAAIAITWSDDVVTHWTAAALRNACPCATCREKKSSEEEKAKQPAGKTLGLPVLSMAEAQPLRIVGMKPVGHYAYNIAFSDGHSSGIYPFESLRK